MALATTKLQRTRMTYPGCIEAIEAATGETVQCCGDIKLLAAIDAVECIPVMPLSSRRDCLDVLEECLTCCDVDLGD